MQRLKNHYGLPTADAVRTAKLTSEFKTGTGIGTMERNTVACPNKLQFKLARKPRCISLAQSVNTAINHPHLGGDFKMKFGFLSKNFRKTDGITMLAEYDVDDPSGFTKESTGSRIE